MYNMDELLKDARAMLEKGNPHMALVLLEDVFKKHPNHIEALELSGACKLHINDYVTATQIYQQLIVLNPSVANHACLASCYSHNKKHQEAIDELMKAIAIDPKEPLLWNNLAIQYRIMGDLDSAFSTLSKAEELAQSAMVFNNIGVLYMADRFFSKAQERFEDALKYDPEYVTAHLNLGLVHFFQNNWQAGFKEFEWRLKQLTQETAIYLSVYNPSKTWNGKDSLKNKKLLIYGEQGMGDIIMFARFAKQFKELGAHVSINIPKCLNPVIKDIEGVDEVLNCHIDDPLPEHDYHISSISAPHLLSLNKICGKPYIPFVKKWPLEGGMHVGVIWSGNPNQPDDKERSIPFEQFSELFSIPGITFHNLEKDSKIKHPNLKSHTIKDFGDTKKILSKLNLVIGCKTAVIHLAGAMGIPVWNLLAYDPDWRWTLDSETIYSKTTHWYDSMLLFRQTQKGDWPKVINQIKERLKAESMKFGTHEFSSITY